jgi:hypothetical protein
MSKTSFPHHRTFSILKSVAWFQATLTWGKKGHFLRKAISLNVVPLPQPHSTLLPYFSSFVIKLSFDKTLAVTCAENFYSNTRLKL